MAKRKTELGLGRGLNALLGDPELPIQNEGSVALPISQVEPGLNQPRKRFDQESLDDLAESTESSNPSPYGGCPPATTRSSPANVGGGRRRLPGSKRCPPSSLRRTTEK